MVLEGAVHQSLGHESHHGHQGAVPQGQFILPAPNLAKQYIVVELGKFGGKLPQSISASCLFYCHINTSYAREKVTWTVPAPSFACKSVESLILARWVKFQVFVP